MNIVTIYRKLRFSLLWLLYLFFAIFPKIHQCISTLLVILSFKKFCVARTFWIELHLDDVLEALLVVWYKFIFYNTWKNHWNGMIDLWMAEILNFFIFVEEERRKTKNKNLVVEPHQRKMRLRWGGGGLQYPFFRNFLLQYSNACC